MKNVQKNSAKFSLENFNANNKLDKQQLNSLIGGNTSNSGGAGNASNGNNGSGIDLPNVIM